MPSCTGMQRHATTRQLGSLLKYVFDSFDPGLDVVSCLY
uniref:Uncharacterized protein n=1 Tax=Aegilops tauschii subsp. strangulata TaxID=200361 RepID=A0A453FH05_AEGTS